MGRILPTSRRAFALLMQRLAWLFAYPLLNGFSQAGKGRGAIAWLSLQGCEDAPLRREAGGARRFLAAFHFGTPLFFLSIESEVVYGEFGTGESGTLSANTGRVLRFL